MGGRSKSEDETMRARKDGFWDADCQMAFDGAAGRAFDNLASGVTRSGDGVVFSAAGEVEFSRREVVPLARSLSILRRDVNWPTSVRVALFAEDALLPPLCESLLQSAFDMVISHDEIRRENDWARRIPTSPPGFRVKAAKIIAMARSPFERTVYLDFDSRPCISSFPLPLLATLEGGFDVSLADNYEGQGLINGEEHYKREHASGCVALRSSSSKTERLLSIYLEAHLLMRSTRRGKRDQPALMVALWKSLSREDLAVATIAPDVFCRKNTSAVVSCDVCTVAHKPARYDMASKVFGIGVKKTGTTSLAAALRLLKVAPEPSHSGSVAATLDMLRDPPNARRAVALAKDARSFSDAPWCMAASRAGFLDVLARTYPRAKFVLTVRDSELWWRSTRNWLACLKPFNVDRYTRMLNAANFSRAAFVGAYEAYNARAVDYFVTRDERHRLLVVDLTSQTQQREASAKLCEFVEAWGSCPTTIGRANAYLESDLALSPTTPRGVSLLLFDVSTFREFEAHFENCCLSGHPDAAPSSTELARCAKSDGDTTVLATTIHSESALALARRREKRDAT